MRDIKDHPEQTVRLPSDMDDAALSEFYRNETTRLLAYLDVVNVGREPASIYDDSIASLSYLYQQHPGAQLHEVKHNTRRIYSISAL